MRVTYIGHSGFLVETEEYICYLIALPLMKTNRK